mmetsp:Transcript_780/g.1841  ORF Transcript_780/g.1841 Transcript_780/m.1841 type:complete len:239 (+) Transcript_780:855-1571(+)
MPPSTTTTLAFPALVSTMTTSLITSRPQPSATRSASGTSRSSMSCAPPAARVASSQASSTMSRARTPPHWALPSAAFDVPTPTACSQRTGARAMSLIASAVCRLSSPPWSTSALASTARASSAAMILPATLRLVSSLSPARPVSLAAATARCHRSTPTRTCTRSSSTLRVSLMSSTPASSRRLSTKAPCRLVSFIRTSPALTRVPSTSFYSRQATIWRCAATTRSSRNSSRPFLVRSV